ncbi:sugar transferase [Mesonia aestuariivivens]|uniref:Sugar transferase n=1 Tax=Mesonia aestuariivivens TaxID=2796128 RepID=A0ABS6W059_9FLAO|nr:sugar transferase [Mesonia aestuariivivens]
MYLKLIKPVFDFLMALFFLLCIFPILLFLASVLFIHILGSPLFFQQRIGCNGIPFTIIIFKTYTRFEQKTSLIEFYRNYKLDELEQLINNLKGEMS